MNEIAEHEIFNIIGEDGFARICAAFYRGVRADDVLGPMYPANDLEGAERRLRDFLIFRFGGPQTYIQERGHPRLRMRHAPFPIDTVARDRWMQLMTSAITEAEIDAPVAEFLVNFLDQMATFLVNRQAD